MSLFNPLAGAVAGQQLAQATQEAEKVRQVRRAEAASKNAVAAGDRFEHEVESTEAVQPLDPNGRQPSQQGRQERSQRRDEESSDGETAGDASAPPHIDLKA